MGALRLHFLSSPIQAAPALSQKPKSVLVIDFSLYQDKLKAQLLYPKVSFFIKCVRRVSWCISCVELLKLVYQHCASGCEFWRGLAQSFCSFLGSGFSSGGGSECPIKRSTVSARRVSQSTNSIFG